MAPIVETIPQAVGRGQRMDVMFEKSFLRTNWARKTYFTKDDIVTMETHIHESPHWFSLASGRAELAIQQGQEIAVTELNLECMYLVERFPSSITTQHL